MSRAICGWRDKHDPAWEGVGGTLQTRLLQGVSVAAVVAVLERNGALPLAMMLDQNRRPEITQPRGHG